MIDDCAKTMDLLHKMEAQLPIPIRPTGALVRALRAQGIRITRDQKLQIKSVLYTGDVGGISCDVTPPGEEKNPIICSLTHVRVNNRHSLAKEIRDYQVERTRRLAQIEGSSKPTCFTIKPRRKRKR